ncbi:MAG: pilus assembly protein TadG-related protein [Anaerosomatales bacterium]
MKRAMIGQVGRDDAGAVAIVVAVMLTVLLGLGAIVIDAGMLYSQRRQIQTAADAAVLAGVQELPNRPAAAVAFAEDYTMRNSTDVDDRAFTITRTYAPNDTITAELRDSAMGLFLARFLGWDEAPVSARATAVISSPAAYGSRVMPFGIMSKEPSGTAPFGYVFDGSEVILKQSVAGGEAGNFQLLSLSEVPGDDSQVVGGNVVRGAIRNGGMSWPVYTNLYKTRPGLTGNNVISDMNQLIGTDTCGLVDVIETDEAGLPIIDDDGFATIVDWDCPRLVVCPIIIDPGPPIQYNWTSLPGASDRVEVIGFAYFFVLDYELELEDELGNQIPPGQARCVFKGVFLRPVKTEDAVEWGPVDPYGVVSHRLID